MCISTTWAESPGCWPQALKGQACSQPLAKLLPLVLEDAFKLGISRDKALVERYLKQIESRIVTLPYKQWFTLLDAPEHKVQIRLQRAGNILGSAYVEVDVISCLESAPTQISNGAGVINGTRENVGVHSVGDQGYAPGSTRIVFSGVSYTPLLPAPKPPCRADILVLENTYGDRNHESRATRKHRLKAAIDRTHGKPWYRSDSGL